MALYCDGDDDWNDGDWWWYAPDDEAPLATKRSRKCCSCGARIPVGATARKVTRARAPAEFEETRGVACYEVCLADWYLCETCGDLADSLAELDFCYTLGDGESLARQIADFRQAEKEDAARQAKWKAEHG